MSLESSKQAPEISDLQSLTFRPAQVGFCEVLWKRWGIKTKEAVFNEIQSADEPSGSSRNYAWHMGEGPMGPKLMVELKA